MDPLVVEEALDLLRDEHVVPEVLTADVRRRDDAVSRQLPHVELVDRQHPVHLSGNRRTHSNRRAQL